MSEPTPHGTYYGWSMERAYGTGWWCARKLGRGRLMADTKGGLRDLIRHEEAKDGNARPRRTRGDE